MALCRGAQGLDEAAVRSTTTRLGLLGRPPRRYAHPVTSAGGRQRHSEPDIGHDPEQDDPGPENDPFDSHDPLSILQDTRARYLN